MTKQTINEQLKDLDHIVKWFEEQKEVDVEKGLEKMKAATILIKSLKTRLKEVENEFELLKEDLEQE